MLWLTAVAIVVAGLSASAAWADNLVTNGSFETPVVGATDTRYTSSTNLGGWTVSNVTLLGTSWQAAAGNQSLLLARNNASGYSGRAYQSVATDPNYTYNLRFAMSGAWTSNTSQARTIRVYWGGTGGTGGTLVGTFTIASKPAGWSKTNMLWQENWITNLPVTASLTELRFENLYSNRYGPTLDDVYLEVAPEPGTLALLALGLPALAWWRRRRRA